MISLLFGKHFDAVAINGFTTLNNCLWVQNFSFWTKTAPIESKKAQNCQYGHFSQNM